MKNQLALLALLLSIYSSNTANAFSLSHSSSRTTQLYAQNVKQELTTTQEDEPTPRRSFLTKSLTTASAAAAATFLSTTTTTIQPANALVKGNAPPPKKSPSDSAKKCSNVEECQEMAYRRDDLQEEEMRANMTPADVTPNGTRYRDIEKPENSSDSDAGVVVAKEGDTAIVYYKVLKLGKRSFDGLSGEGTVVFSRGYGLEDDENKEGDKNFKFQIGDSTVISALNDGIIGMQINGLRRISVLPQAGWRDTDKACDGGPGGSGAGGELKTDYVVVPTATMVATETCFDKGKRPFPTAYAEQRRMAQRFDQSLIMEVKLIGLK